RDDLIANRLKKAVGVIVGQPIRCTDTGFGSTAKRRGRDNGAGDLLGPVYTIGVCGNGPDVRQSTERDRKSKQKLDIAPPTSFTADRDGGLAAREQHARGWYGLMVVPPLTRNARHDTRDLTRFTLDGIAQYDRDYVVSQRDLGRCKWRTLRITDEPRFAARKSRIARFWRLVTSGIEMENHRSRLGDAVSF